MVARADLVARLSAITRVQSSRVPVYRVLIRVDGTIVKRIFSGSFEASRRSNGPGQFARTRKGEQ